MTPPELLAVFREEMNDEATPYLWSDSAIYRYMDDAQKMFCRKTEGIEDARTLPLTRISVAAGTEWYTLSPLILKVRTVTRTDTGRPIPVIAAEKAQHEGVRFDGSEGPIKALVSGLSKQQLRAWPMPNESVTLALAVFRLPLEVIDASGEFEIDEQHHLALLHWMKHKAYDKQDAETFDRRKADDYERKFLDYCAEARKEQERARRPVSTVAYGGI